MAFKIINDQRLFNMKALNGLLKNQTPQQELQLFSKLRQIKTHKPINGVPIVSSDNEEDYSIDQKHNEHNIDITLIKQRLVAFKQRKAREVAYQHNKTKESIESIVAKMRDDLQYQALCIIKPDLKDSVQRKLRQEKDLGSTLPSSVEGKTHKQTPGFDLPTSKSKKGEITIDLRQFTLGQRDNGSSNQSQRSLMEHDSFVSEFQVNGRQPSSKRIKDKIMNSGKSRLH